MIPELENARVTELQVRMDCNGCVQRIKKAMHGVDGVYDVYVDLNQQKLTVIGRADPEKIVRAIKRTRRTATVCSQKEPGQPPNGSEPPPSTAEQPAPEAPANQPPSEAPPAGAPPPSEPPKDAPPQEKPSEAKEVALTKAKYAEEIHMIHLYPHSYAYKAHWNHYPASAQHELPSFIAHGYNSFRLPYYDGQEAYGRDYHRRRGGVDDGNQITSMFDDENYYETPDACTII